LVHFFSSEIDIFQIISEVNFPPPLLRVRTAEERMNPIVRSKLASLAKAGVVGRKARQAQRNRELDAQRRKDTELDRSTRRRTTFQFDLWDKGSPLSTF
jgi:hypothetical protein